MAADVHGVVWRTSLTSDTANALEPLGILRYESDGKIYRYVYNAGATQAANAVMAWSDVAANSVAVNAAAGSACAGITVGALTTLYYGWVQCGGLTGLVVSGAALTAGGAVVAGAGNGVQAAVGSSGSGNVMHNTIGVAQSSSSVSSTIHLKGLV